MELIEKIEDIEENIQTIDNYLSNKTDGEYSFALDLIKRGTCFVVKKEGDTYKFYPSRFIGYKNNTMDKHMNSMTKDGRETNPQISKILHQTLEKNIFEKEYQEYCKQLGFEHREKGTFGVERKYWKCN